MDFSAAKLLGVGEAMKDCPTGLSQQITVLVVTGTVAVRLVSAWTKPALKAAPGVAQVLAVVCGLAYRLEVKGKVFDSAPVWLLAGRRFVGQSVLGSE